MTDVAKMVIEEQQRPSCEAVATYLNGHMEEVN
jgi:hypothetical protein